jgi:hypothetical protein
LRLPQGAGSLKKDSAPGLGAAAGRGAPPVMKHHLLTGRRGLYDRRRLKNIRAVIKTAGKKRRDYRSGVKLCQIPASDS